MAAMFFFTSVLVIRLMFVLNLYGYAIVELAIMDRVIDSRKIFFSMSGIIH